MATMPWEIIPIVEIPVDSQETESTLSSSETKINTDIIIGVFIGLFIAIILKEIT